MGYNVEMLAEIHAKAHHHCWPKRQFCWRYGMTCSKSSLTLKQSYHFTTDFDRVLLQLMDILVKSCAKFDLLFVNI